MLLNAVFFFLFFGRSINGGITHLAYRTKVESKALNKRYFTARWREQESKMKKKIKNTEELWKERNYLNISVWNWLLSEFWGPVGHTHKCVHEHWAC